MVEFLDNRNPEAEWSVEEFARIGTGGATGQLADVVTAHLHWRDTDRGAPGAVASAAEGNPE